jgi:2-keto-4-pentenoate hydratase/2-oxohepta-3-ene-1,7-dioic acid hydratase in catechol pathway
MRLVTFDKNGTPVCGVRRGDAIVDLSLAAPALPRDWPAIFAGDAMKEVAIAAESAPDSALVAAASARLLTPIPKPPKILCVGLNYKTHAEEAKQPIPAYPVIFPRWPTSLVGSGTPLTRPKESTDFDFEAELLIVIGKRGRRIAKDKALDYVAGYSCFNDGSLRDYQFKSSQWAMGKNFDNSGAWGPDIVTADELPPGADGLRIQARLNGAVLQDGNTDDMIFSVATIVSTISQVMTLEPGDIIPTGTPPGVGFARKPPVWMKPGDTMEVEIEGIGTLSNAIVGE